MRLPHAMTPEPKKFDRYEALFAALEDLLDGKKTDLVFVEIGVFNGKRAGDLCRFWREQTEGRFRYIGFDLFEQIDPATVAAELSKSKPNPAKAEVEKKLKAAGADVTLIQGNTRETLPTYVETVGRSIVPDVIFVDGGHSLETIASDWAALKQIVGDGTLVLFDDYYENRDDFGCKQLITGLEADPAWKVRVLDHVDVVESTGLRIRMASVRRAKAIASAAAARAA